MVCVFIIGANRGCSWGLIADLGVESCCGVSWRGRAGWGICVDVTLFATRRHLGDGNPTASSIPMVSLLWAIKKPHRLAGLGLIVVVISEFNA